MNANVLIVEDDAAILRGLKDNFEFEGCRVWTASDGETGLRLARELKPDVIILDLMLPRMQGYEVCRELRQHGCDASILMLTAKDHEADVVLGLKVGADDYITKPFSVAELIARVEARLRRTRRAASTVYDFGDCRLDLTSRVLTRANQPVELSPKEIELLLYFVQHPGRALSRDAIMAAVWGQDSMVTPRSIDRFVTTIRAKIEPEPHAPRFIRTIREFGYKFEPSGS